MTSARRRPLQLVPDPEKPTTTGSAADDDWRAETVLHQWEPGYQLIGALMWMPADTARGEVSAVVRGVVAALPAASHDLARPRRVGLCFLLAGSIDRPCFLVDACAQEKT